MSFMQELINKSTVTFLIAKLLAKFAGEVKLMFYQEQEKVRKLLQKMIMFTNKTKAETI